MRVDRLEAIEQYVIHRGSASLEDIAQEFNISTNTARRDILELLSRNNIKKVYGGVAVKTPSSPMSYISRANDNLKSKDMLGRSAASFVADGDTIYLDSGSTTPNIIKYLKDRKDITVITNNLMVLGECALYQNINLITLGGVYDSQTASFLGSIPLEALPRFSVKTVFLSAAGVSICAGLTTTSYMEAEMKRAISRAGEQCILVTSEETFGHAAAVRFYNFNDLHAIVTDSLPARTYLEIMEKFGIQLICPEAQDAAAN